MILYRPIGPVELELIKASGYQKFPPRLPEQPIFYPVVQEQYARDIARKWNARDSGVGYVTRFEIKTEYIAQFQELVGGKNCTEYWIPAGNLMNSS